MMARSSNAPSIGRIQKRKTNFSKSSLSACNARPVHTDGPRTDKWRRTAARQRGRHSAGQIPAHWAGTEVSDDLSHLNSRPCTLHQCRAHSRHQVQCSCRCCQPLRSPRPLTSGTSIAGMATASFPAIISRPTTAFQFMVRRDQSAALQAMRQATGIMAGGTISAILGFSVDATMAAVSARAGLGRPSGGCGIVGRSAQKVRLTDGPHIAPEPATTPDDDPALIQL